MADQEHKDLGFEPEGVQNLGFEPEKPAKESKPAEMEDAASTIQDSVEDAVRGAAQGGTLGFADEAISGAKALVDKYKDNKDLTDAYYKHLEEERKKFKASEERSPMLYNAGKLGGAAIPAIAGAALAPAGLAGAALTGAIGGGLNAAGETEGNENLLPNVQTGAVQGAVVGPLVHGAGSLIGKGVGKVGQLFSGESNAASTPFQAQVGKAYQMGKAGQELSEKLPAQRMAAESQLNSVKDIVGSFQGAENKLKALVQNKIDHLHALKKAGIPTNKLEVAQREANTAINALKDLHSAGTGSIIGKGLPEEFRRQLNPNLPQGEKLASGVNDLLSNLRTPGGAKQDALRTYNETMKNLAKVDQQYPGLLGKLGMNVPELERKIASKADEFATFKQSMGTQGRGLNAGSAIKSPVTSALGLLGQDRGSILRTVNKAGRVANRVNQSPMVRFGRDLYKQTDEQLHGVADSLSKSGSESISHMGTALSKALHNKDLVAKNAILFNLLQNPLTRAQMEETVPEVDKKEEGE